MKFKSAILTFAISLACVLGAYGQRNLQAGPAVTENFDSLGTATVNVTDNTTITGLYTFRTVGNASPQVFTASSGTSGTATTYNYGVAGTNPVTDRALGGLTGAGTGTIHYGLRFVNSGTLPISSISVGYTGEHWRDQNANEMIDFSYRVSSTPITDLTTGTYTPVAALTYVHNNPTGTNNALDGNAAANRQVFAPVSIVLSSPLLPGHELMLRWTDLDSGGNNDGLAIDDVSVSVIGVTAGAASISGRVLTSAGRGISGAIISVTDASGVTRSVMTNTFGYFRSPELEAGQSYVVSVSARRYTFPTSSQLVNLDDNIDGLTFVASP